MATVSPVKELQDTVICSLCRDYFKDPVILNCGHNFCRACITRDSEPSSLWRQVFVSRSSCPQCREPFRKGEFQPNRQLRNIVDITKKFPDPKGNKACEEHGEFLKLFCEVDQTPICLLCRESPGHKEHAVAPIEEAARDYQEFNSSFLRLEHNPALTCSNNSD